MENFSNIKAYTRLSAYLRYCDLEIVGLNNLIRHFEIETNFWEQEEFTNNGTLSVFGRKYREILKSLQSFYNNMKEVDNESLLNSWENSKGSVEIDKVVVQRTPVSLISYRDPVANFLLELTKENATEASIAFYYLNNIPYGINNNNSRTNLGASIKAYEFENSLKQEGFKKRRKAEKISANFLFKKTETQLNELSNEFLRFSSDYDSWYSKKKISLDQWVAEEQEKITTSIEEGQRRLNITDKTYSDYMSLKAPLQFWEKRIEQYGNSGYLWSFLLAIGIIIVGAVLLKLIYSPPKMFNSDISLLEPLAIKSILLFATLISFSAYFLRTCSRMIFSSFHLKRDAEERHQLTMVYLSLKERGDIMEQERDLIIQAIFSRVDTGLLKGDTSPTMPGISSLFDKLNSK